MHSISLNKSLRFIVALVFILISQVVLAQDIVKLSPNDKSQTKQFLQKLVSIYGKDLKKLNSGASTINNNGHEENVFFNDGKYTFSFKIDLLSGNSLRFYSRNVKVTEDAYQGHSRNLRQLFDGLHTTNTVPPISDLQTLDKFMKFDLTVNLYAQPSFIKRYYNQMWRQYRRPDRLTLGFFGGVNFSTAFVSPFRYSDDTELKTKTRRENEEYLPTGIFGFSAGYSHYSHGVDFFYQHTNYGCKYVEGNQVNWNTGFYGGSTAASDSMKLSFPVNQFGIRYRYSNYFKVVSTYASVGMHLSYVNKDSKNLLQLNSRYLSTGCNLALGLNIHPIYALDIHIAPVMNISFNAVKKTELQTRFSSIALEVGLNYNITFINKRYRTK